MPDTWLTKTAPEHRTGLDNGQAPVAQDGADVPERERLVTIFSALSDPTRMEMFTEIVRRGEVGCAEFDRHFPISKSTISYHTKLLHAAGLIDTRRDGRFFFYRPRLDTIEQDWPHLGQLLRELF
jgi:DNA-binding transcriptional ArsR family regulator